jgi:hypothetical protein
LVKKSIDKRKIPALCSLLSSLDEEQVGTLFDRSLGEKEEGKEFAFNAFEQILKTFEEDPLVELFMNENFVTPYMV